MKKILMIAAAIMAIAVVPAGFAGQDNIAVLKPGLFQNDALPLPHPGKIPNPESQTPIEQLQNCHGIFDTLTWRGSGISVVNFGFTSPGDSMLVWLKPEAPCSLIAIRFRPYNWTGNFLLDIWDARNYDPLIYSYDSTDANGWWGTFDPIDCGSCWVPGISNHSPLGMNALDPKDHPWGPFPYTVTPAHANAWIEIRATAGIQGEVDLGDKPFYIGGQFFIAGGWGFWAEYDYAGARPYNFFKFYSTCCGPDGVHDGWFLRQFFMWFEAIVKYYNNTPPTIHHLRAQNWTYAPGPFPITAVITDWDAEVPARAGVHHADLALDINGTVSRVPMSRSTGDTFIAEIPMLAIGDLVTYWVEAYDAPGSMGTSRKESFMRTTPEHPGADILLIWDYAGDADGDSFFVSLFDAIRGPNREKFIYELWNVITRNGIDESVINYGWRTIYISGWGCRNTLPGYEYEGNPFTEWLDAGTTAEPHNLIYFDQDYFCAQDDYDVDGDGNGCEWEDELQKHDFMYDYFDVVLPVSDAHAADAGGYDSVAIGDGDFAGIRVNFTPDALGYSNPVGALWPDWLVELKNSDEQIFHYKDSGFGAGVRVDKGHYRGVYLPWPDFFAVDSTADGNLVPRPGLVQTIERILHWFSWTDSVEPTVISAVEYGLSQNYPNPFNANTSVNYQIPMTESQTHVTLNIYNILGQEVRTLVDEAQDEGSYTVIWNGQDEHECGVSSGVYFYRLSAGGFSESRRMLLLR